ncbi:hypothetical protein ACWKSP_24505 [Micromonosporaceae bacterium Da 78-11]
MTIDPLRLAESAAAATLTLGVIMLPAAARAFDGRLATVVAAMAVILTSGVYALHAVTFDCFRLTGQRPGRNFSYTRSEE